MMSNLPPGVTYSSLEDQIPPEFELGQAVRIRPDAFRFEEGDPTFIGARGKEAEVVEITPDDGWVYVRLRGTRIIIGCYTNEVDVIPSPAGPDALLSDDLDTTDVSALAAEGESISGEHTEPAFTIGYDDGSSVGHYDNPHDVADYLTGVRYPSRFNVNGFPAFDWLQAYDQLKPYLSHTPTAVRS